VKWLVVLVSLLMGALAAWLFMIRSARKIIHDDDPDDRFGAAALRPIEGSAAAASNNPTAATTALLDADASQVGAYGAGSAAAGPDGDAPSAEYQIKGNTSSMRYHTPDSPYFSRTRAEVWFRTEQDAQRAGFTGWQRKTRQPNYTEGAYPRSALPAAGGAAPSAEFTVKGNESSMRYHTPESPSYDATTAQVWFRTEDDARRAGFAPWRNLS
jgi:hypothetical protein